MEGASERNEVAESWVGLGDSATGQNKVRLNGHRAAARPMTLRASTCSRKIVRRLNVWHEIFPNFFNAFY